MNRYTFLFVAYYLYFRWKTGESTSAKDERIIMLHTMLFYSQLKPVLAKPLLYEEYKMNSYLLNFSPDIILHLNTLKLL